MRSGKSSDAPACAISEAPSSRARLIASRTRLDVLSASALIFFACPHPCMHLSPENGAISDAISAALCRRACGAANPCNRETIHLGSARIQPAAIAQLVRALDCGSRGPPFEPGWRYHIKHLNIIFFSGPFEADEFSRRVSNLSCCRIDGHEVRLTQPLSQTQPG